MQEKKEASHSSISALATFSGYYHGLKANQKYGSGTQEILLAEHIINTAISKENILPRAIANTFWYVPPLARYFADKYINQNYYSTMFTRKLSIYYLLELSIYDGIEQIVFLGSGLDSRPFLTAQKHSGCLVIEADRGKIRQTKLEALRTIPEASDLHVNEYKKEENGSVRINSNLYSLECDLTKDDLAEVLTQTPFTKKKKTLFIAEGLTPYLTREENIKLLDDIHGLACEGSQIFLSYLTSTVSTKSETQALESYNERYEFSLEASEVIPFVTPLGFEVSGKVLNEDRYDLIDDVETKAIYEKNEELKREHYYLLTAKSDILDPAESMSDVDDLNELSQEIHFILAG